MGKFMSVVVVIMSEVQNDVVDLIRGKWVEQLINQDENYQLYQLINPHNIRICHQALIII